MEKKTQNWLIGGCGVLTSLCCVSGVGVAIFAHKDIEHWQPLMNVCAGQPYADAAAPNKHTVRGGHRVGRGWQERGIPHAWATADNPNEISHVLCFDDETQTEVDSAEYENDVRITRYARQRSYRLLEAQTGRTVHQATLTGRLPDFPQTVTTRRMTRLRIRVTSNDRRLDGDAPTFAQLEQEFGKYLR